MGRSKEMLDKVMKIIAEKGIEDINLADVLARELAGMKPTDKKAVVTCRIKRQVPRQLVQNPCK